MQDELLINNSFQAPNDLLYSVPILKTPELRTNNKIVSNARLSLLPEPNYDMKYRQIAMSRLESRGEW